MIRTFAIIAGLGIIAALHYHGGVHPRRAYVTPETVPCPGGVNPHASQTLDVAPPWTEPVAGSCHVRMSPTGYPLPDPVCTPGAINPTVTAAVIKDPSFTTKCLRNVATSEQAKHIVYRWYGIHPPANNRGANQVCELDHLVDLGNGGADTLNNIWPQCGPEGVAFYERYFKMKDQIEKSGYYGVKEDAIELQPFQEQMARDWSKLLPE